MRAGLGLAVAAFLAGCTVAPESPSLVNALPTGEGPSVEIRTADQVRTRLKDACIYAAAERGNLESGTGPACQCYGRGMARLMSPDDVQTFARTGAVPASLRDRADEVLAACGGNPQAFRALPNERQGGVGAPDGADQPRGQRPQQQRQRPVEPTTAAPAAQPESAPATPANMPPPPEAAPIVAAPPPVAAPAPRQPGSMPPPPEPAPLNLPGQN
jgi:hypothetical protein